jgi:hypothetical protein
LPLGLLELNLEGARINLRQKISCVNELTFLERDTNELTIHAAANRNGIERGDGAKTIKVHRKVAALRRRDHNRDYEAPAASTSLALTGGHRDGRI